MITLTGRLMCGAPDEAAIVLAHLPEHIRLTRAEPGCLRFDVVRTDNPMIWQVDETFTDQAAFDGHQARTQASAWYAATRRIKRDFTVTQG